MLRPAAHPAGPRTGGDLVGEQGSSLRELRCWVDRLRDMKWSAGLVVTVGLLGCTAPVPTAVSAVQVVAVAGPTCPVVSDPPDPDCDDRPVVGALIIVRDEGGAEVARLVTDGDGTAVVELSAGRYRLEPQPVEGLMGTAPPVDMTLVDGVALEPVTIPYDTGIR